VRRLFPAAGTVGEVDLDQAYAWPDGPCLRVNFVSSTDGAATVEGRTARLGGAADKAVFSHLRATCDVIVVGAGTASAERYGPAKVPVALVSARLSSSPDERLFLPTSDSVFPLVLTCAAAPADRRAALLPVADIVDCGDESVDLSLVVAELERRGFRRLLCEGGPRLFAGLLACDLVDELCLTLAPVLIAGEAPRISRGPSLGVPRPAALVSALEEESALLLRYSLR